MDYFLYDNDDLRHERVKASKNILKIPWKFS